MELSDNPLQPAQEPQNPQAQTPANEAEVEVTTNLSSENSETSEISETSENSEPVEAAKPKHEVLPRDKQGLLNILKELAEKDASEIHTDEVSRIKQFFYLLRMDEQKAEREAFVANGNKVEDFISLIDPLEEEFKVTLNAIKDKKTAMRAALEAEQAENEKRKRAIIARIIEITADTDNLNRLFPEVRELQVEFRNVGQVPAPVVSELWKAYQDATEHFYDELKINKELRDYDFKKNLVEKEQLVADAEALAVEKDIIHAFKRLQDLHERWREIGPVPKEVREEIWARFKDHSAIINKRYQAYFEERKEAEKVAEEAKREILTQLQALSYEGITTNAAWEEMTKVVTDFQTQWRSLGFASRKVNNELYAQFRQLCDSFFQAKSRYYKERREGLAENLAKKTALCEQAEALVDNTNWREATNDILALKEEWRKVGPVPRKVSDELWQRFIKACDAFFDNKKKSTSGFRKAEKENLAAKREIIEKIAAISPELTKDEALTEIRDLQAQWQKIGHVPFADKDEIYTQYREKCDAVYDRLGERDRSQRMENFRESVNAMSGDDNKVYRERERLTRQYERMTQELKTYENNLSFFNSKSKSGDSMLREAQKRIDRLKQDLEELQAKIKELDNNL